MAKPYPPVRVVWTDAESAGDNWETPEECLDWCKKPLRCGDTIGFLIFKGKDYVVVYGTIMPGACLHGLKIPRKWIQEIQYLDTKSS